MGNSPVNHPKASRREHNASSGDDVTAKNPPAESVDRSWGDRFKKTTFNKGTYTGINYFLNAAVSTVITYGVETRLGDKINGFCDRFGKYKTNAFGASRALLITSGGNALVVAIKGLEDHRQELQFGIGHELDTLQETLGRGNSASTQNIADYAKIKQVMKNGDTSAVTDAEKQRWSRKYRLQFDADGKPAFIEHVLPWHKAIVSRLGAFASAMVLNSLVIGNSRRSTNEWLNYDRYAEKISPWVSKKVFNRFPGPKLKDSDAFTEILFNEAISTISSSVPHRMIQNQLHKDISDSEYMRDNPNIDEKKQMFIAESVRKKIIPESPKDFRTRESNLQGKSAISIT